MLSNLFWAMVKLRLSQAFISQLRPSIWKKVSNLCTLPWHFHFVLCTCLGTCTFLVITESNNTCTLNRFCIQCTHWLGFILYVGYSEDLTLVWIPRVNCLLAYDHSLRRLMARFSPCQLTFVLKWHRMLRSLVCLWHATYIYMKSNVPSQRVATTQKSFKIFGRS